MNSIIGLRDFREKTKKYIDEVNKGKSFLVFKRSTPVFKISPIQEKEVWETVVDFTKIDKEGVDIDDVIAAL